VTVHAAFWSYHVLSAAVLDWISPTEMRPTSSFATVWHSGASVPRCATTAAQPWAAQAMNVPDLLHVLEVTFVSANRAAVSRREMSDSARIP
jgi:hypothetical protein